MLTKVTLYLLLGWSLLINPATLGAQTIMLDGDCFTNGPETFTQDGTLNGKPAYTATVDFGGFGPTPIQVYWQPAVGSDPAVWIMGSNGAVIYFLESMEDMPPGTEQFTYQEGPDSPATGCANAGQFALTGMDAFLPVTWLSFTAEDQQKRGVLLAWTTQSEVENAGFAVERSLDGRGWQQLGFVAAASPDQVTTSAYQFIDDTAPVNGTLLYRLRQEDTDGAVSYSITRQLQRRGTTSLMLFPNPIMGNELNITGTDVAGARYTLTNQQGQTLHSGRLISSGLDVSRLPTGVYTLTIAVEREVITRRFIRQ